MPAKSYDIVVMVPVAYEVEAVDEQHACSAALRRARDQFPKVELPDNGGTAFHPFHVGAWVYPPRRKRGE